MSAEPPAGYNPGASMLSGAGNASVPIIKMSGGGQEPPNSYTEGGYTQSLLPGGDTSITKMTGGGLNQESLDKLKITEDEFSQLDDTAGMSYSDFMEAILQCNSVSELDKTRCDTAKTVLRQIFIVRLQNYIEECQGFVATGEAGEAKLPTAASMATKMARALGAKPKEVAEAQLVGALPSKLVQDPSTGVWRAPKEYENAEAAIQPIKGQWVPGSKAGEWKPAPITKAIQTATPGKVGGPKFLKRLPDGDLVATTQSDPAAIPVDPSVTYKQGKKPGQWIPATAAEPIVSPAPEAPVVVPGVVDVTSFPYGPEPAPAKVAETPEMAADRYAKIKFIFELIDFLPTLRTDKNLKPIPQPDVNSYTYKSMSDLIRASIAIFGSLLSETRTKDRSDELSKFNIPSNWEPIDTVIGTRRVIPDAIRKKILDFISDHETLIQIRGKEDREIIEGIYSQVFNFISDIANIPVYNKLGDQSSQLISYGSIIDEKIPELSMGKGFLGIGKKKKQDINYISVFFRKSFPTSAPADYKISVFAWRNGLSKHFERDLTTADKIGKSILKQIEEPLKIKLEEKGFNMMMRRLFSKYENFNEDDVKTFETLHDKISGYDLLYNLFIKHDANPFSAFSGTYAGAALPETKTLNEYAKESLARMKTYFTGVQKGGSDNEEQVGGAGEDTLWAMNINDIKSEATPGLINALNDAVTTITQKITSSDGTVETKYNSFRNLIIDYIVLYRLLLNTLKLDLDENKKNTVNIFFVKIYDILQAAKSVYPKAASDNTVLASLKTNLNKTLTSGEFDALYLYLTMEQLSSLPDYCGEFITDILDDYETNASDLHIMNFPTGGQIDNYLGKSFYELLVHFKDLVLGLRTQYPDSNLLNDKPDILQFLEGNDAPEKMGHPAFETLLIVEPFMIKEHIIAIFTDISTKLSLLITKADLKYINDIVIILSETQFKNSILELYSIHSNARSKSSYKYEYLPLDKFERTDVQNRLGTEDSFIEDSFDVMQMIKHFEKNKGFDEVNSIRRDFIKQILNPYLIAKMESFITTFRDDVVNAFNAHFTTITTPPAELSTLHTNLDAINTSLTTALAGHGATPEYEYVLNNLFSIDDKISNDTNNMFIQMCDLGIQCISSMPTPDDAILRSLQEYEKLFGKKTQLNIGDWFGLVKEIYNRDTGTTGKTAILTDFFDNAKDNVKLFVQNYKDTKNIEIINDLFKYYSTISDDTTKYYIEIVLEYFGPYYDILSSPKAVAGATLKKKTKGGAIASEIDVKEPEEYAYFTNGIKFIEYPADILCGKPGSLEREKFIELLIALFCRLLVTILDGTKPISTQKEYMKAFFFLLNQLDIYMYSIGEKNNSLYQNLLSSFTSNPNLNKFLKMTYFDYFKTTTDKGNDKSFIPKKTREYIGEALLQNYPEFTKRAWFGGGRSGRKRQRKQKGGFKLTNPFAGLLSASTVKVSSIFDYFNNYFASKELYKIKTTYLFDPAYIGINNIRLAIQRLRLYDTEYKIMTNVQEGGQPFFTKYPDAETYILPSAPMTTIADLKAFEDYIDELIQYDIPGLFGTSKRKYSDEDSARLTQFAEIMHKIAFYEKEYIKNTIIGTYKGPAESLKFKIHTIQQDIYNLQIGEDSAEKTSLIDRLQNDKVLLQGKLDLAYRQIGDISSIEDNIINKLINILALDIDGYSGFPAIDKSPTVDKFKYKSKEFKLYAGDLIKYVQNIHNLLKEKDKDGTSKLRLPNIKLDSYLNDANKFFDDLYTTTMKNIANVDDGQFNGIFIDYVKKFLISGTSKEINYLYTDDKIGITSGISANKIAQKFYVSDSTYRVYINNTNNLERGLFYYDKHMKLMKELQGHFRILIGPLAKPQILNNELLRPFYGSATINKIKTIIEKTPPKAAKGAAKPAGGSDPKKQQDENKGVLNACFNIFMESPDPYEFEEFIAALHFVLMNPKLDASQGKLLKEIEKNRAKYTTSYKFIIKFLGLPDDYEYFPPPGYLEPTVFIQGPPPKRYRFRMDPLGDEDVGEYMMKKDTAEFIANREAFNLLFDSISTRIKVYNDKIRDIEKQRKQKLPNVSYPIIDNINDDNSEQLEFLAAILYGYGRKARCEYLGQGEEGECPVETGPIINRNIKEGSSVEKILKRYPKVSLTEGAGLSFEPSELESIVNKIDLNRLDIVAPPYMFMTSEQRDFAFKFCEEKIKDLTYLEVLNLLLRLLNNYDNMGLTKSDLTIVRSSSSPAETREIAEASQDSLTKLKTASLVIRYNSAAKSIIKNMGSVTLKSVQKAPQNYSTFLNTQYGNVNIKLFEEERLKEEGIEDTLLDELAEEPIPDYDYTTANISSMGSLVKGGSIKRLVANATARARSQYSKKSSGRGLTTRKNIHREHNKHTRKNK